MPAAATGTVPRAVGVYLGVLQFAFALCWVVYAAYLPQLLRQLGFEGQEQRIVPWVLAMDQLIFLLTDWLVGTWSDQAAQVLHRLSLWMLGGTLVSGGAFALLPQVAAGTSLGLFLALTVLWAITSAALRAPPLTLLGRYVSRPAQPALVALMALGLGLCNALAPYLALQLKTIDPRWPFALSALVLVAVTLGMHRAEAALARARATPADEPSASMPRSAAAPAPARVPDASPEPAAAPPRPGAAALCLLAACALAALAFQAHVFLISGPLYLRHLDGAAQLPQWLPLFWVGFNLALWPASRWARALGAPRVLALGLALATAALALVQIAAGLSLLATAQLLAGAAWAVVMCAAFCSVLALGHTGREGMLNGALQSVLALGALTRLLVVALVTPVAAQLLAWSGLVVLLFAAAALLLLWGLKRLPGWPAPA
ncbi:MAG: hypothetical protein JNJ71_01000 [Rubrivivax sp.]|nr:hypothetical protein [Rubrivivax sp.]